MPSLVEMITLRTEKFVAQQVIPRWILEGLHVESFRVEQLDDLVVRLTKYIAYLEDEKGEVRVPRTWWDHTKLRWFPSWLYRWVSPPQYRVYSARAYFADLPPRPFGSDVQLCVFQEKEHEDPTFPAAPTAGRGRGWLCFRKRFGSLGIPRK